tara:strand:+ start:655 stop:1047 length:393 start_codon:yes stop_codon:yes gene_type:complete
MSIFKYFHTLHGVSTPHAPYNLIIIGDNMKKISLEKKKKPPEVLVFEVDSLLSHIHSVSDMKITKNTNNNTFNVFFSVDWFGNPKTHTDFDYRNVPKESVFDLVTGPSWTGNESVWAHHINEEILREFIK